MYMVYVLHTQHCLLGHTGHAARTFIMHIHDLHDHVSICACMLLTCPPHTRLRCFGRSGATLDMLKMSTIYNHSRQSYGACMYICMQYRLYIVCNYTATAAWSLYMHLGAATHAHMQCCRTTILEPCSATFVHVHVRSLPGLWFFWVSATSIGVGGAVHGYRL